VHALENVFAEQDAIKRDVEGVVGKECEQSGHA